MQKDAQRHDEVLVLRQEVPRLSSKMRASGPRCHTVADCGQKDVQRREVQVNDLEDDDVDAEEALACGRRC